MRTVNHAKKINRSSRSFFYFSFFLLLFMSLCCCSCLLCLCDVCCICNSRRRRRRRRRPERRPGRGKGGGLRFIKRVEVIWKWNRRTSVKLGDVWDFHWKWRFFISLEEEATLKRWNELDFFFEGIEGWKVGRWMAVELFYYFWKNDRFLFVFSIF